MNVGKGAVVAALSLVGLVALGGIGFGYQQYRVSEVYRSCKSNSLNLGTAAQAQAQMDELAACIDAAEAVPFKNAEIKSKLNQANRQLSILEVKASMGNSAAQPVASEPVAASNTTIAVVANKPIVPVSFDQLSPCEQLDSITRSGKSVSEFLVASAKVGDLAKYRVAIGSTCTWNGEQLEVADRILNPPVIVTAPIIEVSGSSGSGSSSGGRVTPAPGWNNCNGIRERGESYSADCHVKQLEDYIDSHPKHPYPPKPYPQPNPQPSNSPEPPNPHPMPSDPGYYVDQSADQP